MMFSFLCQLDENSLTTVKRESPRLKPWDESVTLSFDSQYNE